MRRWAAATLGIATVLTVMLGQPRAAEAARGIVIYHSGNDVFPAGPLPEPFSEHPQLQGAEAAFRCSIFGLFWAYFHIWDCKPVAIKGTAYFEDAALTTAIAAKYKEGDMKVGLWTKHGRWALAAALIGGVVVFGLFGRGDDDEDGDDEDGDDDVDEDVDEGNDRGRK